MSDAEGVRMIPISGGHKVWTRRVGMGTRKMLTLHGGPGCTHEYFECFEDFLPQKGIEFYYYDQLGSLNSDRPDDPSLWTVDRFREEVEEVRSSLGLRDFYLYGQSWGGMLGIEYALRHQENLRALIVSNMTASIASYMDYLNELRQRLPQEIIRKMEEFEARKDYSAPEYEELLLSKIYTRHICRADPWPDAMSRALQHMNTQVYNTMQGPNEFVVLGNFKDWNRWNDLHRIEVPTLLLVGEFDTMRVADIEKMGSLIPRSRVAVIEGGSHCTMWDGQSRYFEELLRFVEDVEHRRI